MIADEKLAGLIVFPIALIGVFANWTVALLIRRLPSLKNSFGRLTASQSIGDAIHSTVFSFLFSPMCFFGIDFMKEYSSVIGHILLIAYDISTYSHLCISLNRFCSIVAPIQYDTIFSMSNTKKLIMFSWACLTQIKVMGRLAELDSLTYDWIFDDCKFYYIDDFWVFTFSTTPVCETIVWYADFLKYNSIVLSIVIIDIITVSKVRSFKVHLSSTSSQSHAKKRSAEMNFLKQACLQAFVFVCELITYFLITPRVDGSERWLRFFLSTVAWVCVHMLDGIITLSFNKEFTQTIFRGIKIKDLSGYSTRHPHTENTSNAGSKTKH
ncbi:hypothetical protein GCK72_013818 [Caenorhabditis remanei]|uniref:7TM GPCR serpentine receptor class x (Srx) domain-containing protein n=1 Tax=Caenorhabditis remanei TaxID=31234 RepID=A0A6A5GS59_CAERE|nr:hypothetical protein GCK72_013818 [Caenorhabditis remanei]KAF1757363.1 hypothetical protein GCK72_013818 [Caenorhabditis remanei]